MRQLTIAFAVLLGACGGGEPAEPQSPAAPARESAVFEPLTGTLDRAAGVEDTLRESAAARRRQLEAQE